jgi:hypothetical protein
MSQHDPGVRTQHRDVVGDGLGVAGTDADVDEGDTPAMRQLDVVGGHLRDARRPLAGAPSAKPLVAGRKAARLHELVVIRMPFGHVARGEPAELVDVKGVVREDHEVLEMLGVGTRVMAQPMQ